MLLGSANDRFRLDGSGRLGYRGRHRVYLPERSGNRGVGNKLSAKQRRVPTLPFLVSVAVGAFIGFPLGEFIGRGTWWGMPLGAVIFLVLTFGVLRLWVGPIPPPAADS
jgi:hypothetical protein